MCHAERHFHRPSPARAAFALSEVLVVIAISAALVALLLPVVTVLREASRQTVCGRVMGQVALATAAYCTDNEGAFPARAGGQTQFTRLADYGIDRNRQRLCPVVTQIVSGFATTWNDLRANRVGGATYRFNLGLVDGDGSPATTVSLAAVKRPDQVVLLLERFTVIDAGTISANGTFDVVAGQARVYNPHRTQRVDPSLPGSAQDPRACTGGTNYATVSGRVAGYRLMYACGARSDAWDGISFAVK